jgi:hypothetical protein
MLPTPQSYMASPYAPPHSSPPHVHFADTPTAPPLSTDNPIIAAAHASIGHFIGNPDDFDSDSFHATLQTLSDACSDPNNRL